MTARGWLSKDIQPLVFTDCKPLAAIRRQTTRQLWNILQVDARDLYRRLLTWDVILCALLSQQVGEFD